jgi:hypothetical protein
MAKKLQADGAPSTYWTQGSYTACYHSHPALVFTTKGGHVYELWGGNCMSPVVHDADVYIGFAGSARGGDNAYPWEPGYRPVVTVDYHITDMQPPKDPVSFHALVAWTADQLFAGKKVHAGCMGGHGRTGLFFAAVVAYVTGMKDAIQYVRKHYCKKAVETPAQVAFLMAEFGVSTAEETKKPYVAPKPRKGSKAAAAAEVWGTNYTSAQPPSAQKQLAFAGATRTIKPVPSPKNIWK